MSLNQAVWAFALGATCMGLLGILAPGALAIATQIVSAIVIVCVVRNRWSRRA